MIGDTLLFIIVLFFGIMLIIMLEQILDSRDLGPKY